MIISGEMKGGKRTGVLFKGDSTMLSFLSLAREDVFICYSDN